MRTAEFDKEQVLRAAITTFVNKGYNKASMQDLKKSTGLHPGSIYCAFENKQGLLIAALEQYNKDSSKKFAEFFSNRDSVLTGLQEYLEFTVGNCVSSGPERVCFSQQALSELTKQAPEVEAVIAKNLGDWQQGFTRVFEQALAAGEIDDGRTPLQRTQSLVMGIYGLRTFAHTHPTSDILQELAQQLFEDVCR